MIVFKINVLQALTEKGYGQARIRKENLIGQKTMGDIKRNDVTISAKVLNTLCRLLECDVGDILQYIPDETPPTNNDPD